MANTELGINIYNPPELGNPLSLYSHLTHVSASQATVYIAGMVAVDRDGRSVGVGSITEQLERVFRNISLALDAERLTWANIAQFTTYLTDADYIDAFLEWRNASFPRMFPDGKYPPNTLLVVKRLLREEFLVEVQSVAVKP